MGARVAADVLEHHGFSVRLLGPSVPLPALLDRIRSEAPDVVLLSVTMGVHLPALRVAVEGVAREFPQIPVLVGGRGIDVQSVVDARPFPDITARMAAVCAEIERLLTS